MRISTIGEFALIERIKSMLPRPHDALLGIGDDCAALRPTAGTDLLLTTDLLVEGVDFTLQTITPFRLGRKAMGVNLSDIAAMGGLPRAALAVLAISPDGEIEFVDELYRGLQEEGARFGIEVVGGDLSASSTLTIGVTLVGEVKAGKAVTRSGAKPGERIWVTGRLGAAAAGLAALRAGYRLRDNRGPPDSRSPQQIQRGQSRRQSGRPEGREPLPDKAGESPLLSRSGGEKGLRGGGAGKPQCSSRGRPGFRGTLWVASRVPSALSTSNS